MLSPMMPTAFACRYNLQTNWKDGPPSVIYFICEDLDVTFADGAPQIVDCAAIDIVAVV